MSGERYVIISGSNAYLHMHTEIPGMTGHDRLVDAQCYTKAIVPCVYILLFKISIQILICIGVEYASAMAAAFSVCVGLVVACCTYSVTADCRAIVTIALSCTICKLFDVE